MEKAGSFEIDKVKKAADGIEFNAPSGVVKIEGANQHIWKTARIGQVQADGQFKEVWKSGESIKPDPYLESYEWGASLSNKK